MHPDKMVLTLVALINYILGQPAESTSNASESDSGFLADWARAVTGWDMVIVVMGGKEHLLFSRPYKDKWGNYKDEMIVRYLPLDLVCYRYLEEAAGTLTASDAYKLTRSLMK